MRDGDILGRFKAMAEVVVALSQSLQGHIAQTTVVMEGFRRLLIEKNVCTEQELTKAMDDAMEELHQKAAKDAPPPASSSLIMPSGNAVSAINESKT